MPLLRMEGISKSFPGVRALDSVDFDLERGDVHALVGENGAGKSTLMKILAGVYRTDSGVLRLDDQVIEPTGPRSMIDAGVGVIYQELNLVPHLSLAENVFLGREPLLRSGAIDWKKMGEDFRALIESFDVPLEPFAQVASIGPAYQQVVEIVKALSLNAKILVMDEPTAALTGHEVDRLFELINQLQSDGVSLVYISHRLEEIWRVANRVTVLRDGQRISSKALKEVTIDSLIKDMVGRNLEEQYPKQRVELGEEAIRVEHLTKAGICEDVSFSVKRGEIVGFSGLVGAGRTEIAQLIFGYRKKDSGTIFLDGEEVSIDHTWDAVNHHIALIPEERKEQGLVLGQSVFDNVALPVLNSFSRLGRISFSKLRTVIEEIVQRIGVRTPSLQQQVKNLSGGNQQKVVLSKWFVRRAKIYIFDEPTRGIDVGAKVEIYKLMQRLAQDGAAIIMISSELPEIMNMPDRIIAVRGGKITGEFTREEATEEQVMRAAFGIAEDAS
ncbi:MAG TPA: sugar ABC transporter ATP-binding protein [Alkalispirochaeta sp.]|nr:sugar ABC transporter ATP-binding protein [Alkalispirochaeta sp.]